MEKSRRFRWGNDYLRNVTANSFEDYRVKEDENGEYYVRAKQSAFYRKGKSK